MSSSAVKKTMTSSNTSNLAGNSSSSSKGKMVNSTLKRKIETVNRIQSVDTKNKSVVTQKGVKFESSIMKEKGKATTSKTTVKKVVKRERKVYTLAGQKHDPPEEREPLRIFYESLWKQIPTSEMAEFWMMEHGLLSPEKAKKAYEKKQRKQKQLRSGTPIKSPPPRAPPSKPPPPSRSAPPSKPTPPSRPTPTSKPTPPSRTTPTSKPAPPSRPTQISKPESSNRPKVVSKNGEAKAKRRYVDDDDDDNEVIPSPKIRKV